MEKTTSSSSKKSPVETSSPFNSKDISSSSQAQLNTSTKGSGFPLSSSNLFSSRSSTPKLQLNTSFSSPNSANATPSPRALNESGSYFPSSQWSGTTSTPEWTNKKKRSTPTNEVSGFSFSSTPSPALSTPNRTAPSTPNTTTNQEQFFMSFNQHLKQENKSLMGDLISMRDELTRSQTENRRLAAQLETQKDSSFLAGEYITELKAKVKAFEAALGSSGGKSKGDTGQLQKDLGKVKAERDQLKTELEAAKKLVTELEMLKDEHKLIEELAKEQEEELERIRIECDGFKKEKETVKEELERMKIDCENLRTEKKTAEEAVRVSKEKEKNLEEQVSLLEKLLEEEKAVAEERYVELENFSEDERRRLDERCAELETRLAEIEDENTKNKQTLAVTTDVIDGQKDLQELRNDREILMAHIKDAKADVAQLRYETADLDRQVNKMTLQLDDLLQQRDLLSAKIDDTRNEIPVDRRPPSIPFDSSFPPRLDTPNDHQLDPMYFAGTDQSTANEEIDGLRSSLIILEEENMKLIEMNDENTKEIKMLKSENERKEANLQDMSKILKAASRELDSRHAEIAKLQISSGIAPTPIARDILSPSRIGSSTPSPVDMRAPSRLGSLPSRPMSAVFQDPLGNDEYANNDENRENIERLETLILEQEEALTKLQTNLDEALEENDKLRSQFANKDPSISIPPRRVSFADSLPSPTRNMPVIANGNIENEAEETTQKTSPSEFISPSKVTHWRDRSLSQSAYEFTSSRFQSENARQLRIELDKAQAELELNTSDIERLASSNRDLVIQLSEANVKMMGLEEASEKLAHRADELQDEIRERNEEVEKYRDQAKRAWDAVKEQITTAAEAATKSFDGYSQVLVKNTEPENYINELCRILVRQTPLTRRSRSQLVSAATLPSPSRETSMAADNRYLIQLIHGVVTVLRARADSLLVTAAESAELITKLHIIEGENGIVSMAVEEFEGLEHAQTDIVQTWERYLDEFDRLIGALADVEAQRVEEEDVDVSIAVWEDVLQKSARWIQRSAIFRDEIDKLKALMVEQNQFIAEQEKTISIMKESNTKDIDRLKSSLNTMTDSLRNALAGTADGQQLQAELDSLRSLWEDESSTAGSFRTQLHDLSASASHEAQKHMDILINQIEFLTAHLKSSKSLADEYEAKLQQAEAELKTLREDNEFGELTTNSADTKLGDLKSPRASTGTLWEEEEEGEHPNGIGVKSKAKNEVVQNMAVLEAKLSEATKNTLELSEKITGLQKEVELNMHKVKTLTEEKISWQRERSELHLRVKTAEHELEDARQNGTLADTYQSQIRQLKHEKDVLKEQTSVRIQGLEREIQTVLDKSLALTREKAELERERASIERRLMATVESQAMLEAELQAERDHTKNLQEEFRKLSGSLGQERTARIEYEMQRDIILSKVSLLEIELDETKKVYEAQVSELQKALNKQPKHASGNENVENHTAKKNVLQSEIAQAQTRFQDVIGAAQTEVATLKNEVESLRGQLTRPSHGSTIIPPAIDSQTLQDLHEAYTSEFAKKLAIERRRHVEASSRHVKEIRYLKAKWVRESGFRADLGYQKQYLLLLIGGLQACEQATLNLIASMGLSDSQNPSRKRHPATRRFRRAITIVIAIQRMRILKESWGKTKAIRPRKEAAGNDIE